MSSSTKRFYSLLLSLAMLLGAVFIYSSYIVPAFKGIETLRGEIAGYSAQVKQLSTINQNIANLSSEYQNSSAMQSTISAILPTQENVPVIINQVQGLAASSNVNIDSISFQYLPINYKPQGSIVQGVGTIAMSVQGSGSYSSVSGFLNNLGNNVRLFDLSSLSLAVGSQPAGSKSAVQILHFNMVINTYYQTAASSTSQSGS